MFDARCLVGTGHRRDKAATHMDDADQQRRITTFCGCVPDGAHAARQGAPSATQDIADMIRTRVPHWHLDTVHSFVHVLGDPQADAPGRHIVCDGMTDRPIITANVDGMRVMISVPPVSDAIDRRRVLDILQAAGAIPPRTQ